MPTEAIFRRATWEMTSAGIRQLGADLSPIFVISVPSPLMIAYAVVYLLLLFGVAQRQFARRDL
jgi:hypothetical protein